MDLIIYKTFWKKKEVEKLLNQYKPVLRIDLKEKEDSASDYYEFVDGKLLLVLGFGNGSGTMYESIEQYNKMMNEPGIRKNGEHVLSDLILDKNVFIEQVHNYVNLLSERLNISFSRLDFSLESIKKIDRAYKKYPREMSDFFNHDYLYLIAYLGEVYRKQTGGSWFFKKDLSNKLYEPYIKIHNGVLIDTFLGLFKECYEHFENFSVYNIVVFELSKVR